MMYVIYIYINLEWGDAPTVGVSNQWNKMETQNRNKCIVLTLFPKEKVESIGTAGIREMELPLEALQPV